MAVNDITKFRQIYNQENNIYVEADYDNIILIDPNKVIDANKNVKDRYVQQENLVMYANLETQIIPRTKLAIGDTFDSPVVNSQIASLSNFPDDLKLNFLKPKGKKAFDTSWSDEFTGRGARVGKGINQNAEYKTLQNGENVFKQKVLNYEDTQTLGITRIEVKIKPANVTEVTIDLIDIRGRALFEQGDNSLYSVFFNLPYPPFFLILKGYYGKAIRYQLSLVEFNASFEPDSGNFKISLKLLSRNSAILADSIIAYAKHSPKMFQTETIITTNTSNSFNNGVNTNNVQTVVESIGVQKMKEAYSVYKSKGLITSDFPEITIEEFIAKIENLPANFQAELKKADFTVMKDVQDFQTNVIKLRNAVFANSVNEFLDPSEKILKGQILYPYKESISYDDRIKYKNRVETDIKTYVDALKANKSFGTNGEYKLPNAGKIPGEIPIKISITDVFEKVDFNKLTDDEFRQSYAINYGNNPTDNQLNKYITDFKSTNPNFIYNEKTNQLEDVRPDFYKFGDKVGNSPNYVPDSFLDKIQKISDELNRKNQQIEQELTEFLADKVVNGPNSLGFIPTIRNVCAVIFAGLDGFYRMMENTHQSAWNQRTNPTRLASIIPPTKKFGVDSKNLVNGTNLLNDLNVVYPWPQYFEKEKQKDGTELYVIKYPGDPSVINTTKGFDGTVWPEVAFTEAYMNAITQKIVPPNPNSYPNSKSLNDVLSINALEYPFKVIPYTNTQEQSYLYEIFERSYVGAHYAKMNRTGYNTENISTFLGNLEAKNITTTAVKNNTLTQLLKDFRFTYTTFLSTLRKISNNGTGTNWTLYSDSSFVTEYIKNLLELDSGTKTLDVYNNVYSFDTLKNSSVAIDKSIPLPDSIKNFINGSQANDTYYLDNYPITNVNWLKTNLQGGQNITTVNDFNKTQTFLYLDEKKTLGRIDETETLKNIGAFVSKYGFKNFTQPFMTNVTNNVPVNSQTSLSSFYSTRLEKDLYLTESIFDYGNSYSGQVGTKIQTTSLINTPYFVNAIVEGVENQKNNVTNPYVALGYLYLNSLPLITTREKLKTFDETSSIPTDLDYLASTFNKFSAIHKLPYAWVLKYGSIWHRYKKYVETNVDILDNKIWNNFDYLKSYDTTGTTPSSALKIIVPAYTGGSTQVEIQLQTTIPLVVNPSQTLDNITLGFYPKVINNVYRYFYSKDLPILTTPTYQSFLDAYNNNGFRTATNQSSGKFYTFGFDLTNPNRSLGNKNYYTFFDNPENSQNFLIIPSQGGIKINQTNFECFNTLDQIKEEVFNNNSVYNGSVRTLWGISQFGYFNNSLIRKPLHNEYLKTIYTDNSKNLDFELRNTTSTYSNIEEIFSVFEPEILDKFEKLFLSFCNPTPSVSDIVLIDEVTNSNYTNVGGVSNVKEKRLFHQMEALFMVPKNSVSLLNDEAQDGIRLAEKQISNFFPKLVDFLNFDCVLKLGNPGNFKRRVFNYFSGNAAFTPLNPLTVPNYVNGTLPSDGTILPPTLIQSIAAKPAEWKALKKYVGEFTQDGIKYADSGSTITDFFTANKGMDVEFTVSNIETFYPLIRLFAKQKLEDPTLNKTKFQQSISNFLLQQQNFNSENLTQTFTKLNADLPTVTVKNSGIVYSSAGNVAKLETYSLLKTMNDKWISGTDFLNKTIFEDFLFQDKAGRDVGNEITIDLEKIKDLLKSNDNSSMLAVVSNICANNNMIFYALPAYVNFYGIQQAVATNQSIPVDATETLFGTFLDVDYIKATPKFLLMYVGKPSEFTASNAAYSRFADDSFDIRKSSDNPLRRPSSPNEDYSKKNRVVGFSVDYGTQNQSIFKSVSIDMSEKKNTAESNKLFAQLGASVAGDKVAQQTVSLYSIYKSRSYVAKVDMMGNAMIQPTMYFNLRHVPLFYGPYMVLSVSHSVAPGKFETSLEGVRVSRYSLPQPNSLIDTLNQNYLNVYKESILKETKVSEAVVNVDTKQGTVEAGSLQAPENICLTATTFTTVPFVDINLTPITSTDLQTLLNSKITTALAKLKPLYYGIAFTRINNKVDLISCSAPNYNLFEISTSNNYGGSMNSLITQQVCLTTALEDTSVSKPYAVFESFEKGLEFFNSLNQAFLPIIESLKNSSTETTDAKKYAEAYSLYTLFRVEGRFVSPAGGVVLYTNLPTSAADFTLRKAQKVNSSFPDILDIYNRYKTVFENAYVLFFP